MKICMLVYNNATKDNRVMREANSLQMAGHQVTVIGIPDADAKAPIQDLENGVRVYRVLWQAGAYARFLRSAIFRIVPVALVIGLVVWGLFELINSALSMHIKAPSVPKGFFGTIVGAFTTTGIVALLLKLAVVIVVVFAIVRLLIEYFGAIGASGRMKANELDTMQRYAEALFNGEALDPKDYPAPESRVPTWVPDILLELLLEPLEWFGGKSGRLVLYRYRSEEMAALAIRLKPDAVHAHDCLALPTGVLVKKALNIPLVYDAHEIYEATASRRFGIADYYMRLHRKLLPLVDRFITVNDSIASFYRFTYPWVVVPVVLRNATTYTPPFDYDGRLHERAGLPPAQKILLYQGGYTPDRGLPTLVRAAPYLPDGWTLVMMGWGPLAGELKQIAAHGQKKLSSFGRKRREWLAKGEISPEAAPKVVFLPGVKHDELPFWTAGATAGIVPYENKVLNHWFCSPNKVWEFPNAGVPLIVQPFPELKKVVETYQCGWVMPEDLTPGTIADTIAGLTDEMIAEAREGCRRFIAADRWEVAYEQRLIDLYKSLEEERGMASQRPQVKVVHPTARVAAT
jgi:glycosyltransferase involved in cell wall biosynthesis